MSEVHSDNAVPVLSVIMPVYNEERTVDEVLRRVVAAPYPYPEKEVIVVDDGSRDGTAAILEAWSRRPGIRVLRHERNRGKGAAVRTGLQLARGRIAIIQDADLEYDPNDYARVVEPVRLGRAAAVYGSRYLPGSRAPWTSFRGGVVFLNGVVRLLFGRRLTDEATCYKALPTALYRQLDLQSERFELCAEITAKLARRGVRIEEVPIAYRPRRRAEGKKLRWRDGWHALAALIRWRLA